MAKRSLYLLITVVLAAVLSVIGWQAVREDLFLTRWGDAWRMPKSLAGKSLIAQKSGAVALAEIESLHSKGIELTDGMVVRYGDAMTRRTAEGRSPFTPTGTRPINGRTV